MPIIATSLSTTRLVGDSASDQRMYRVQILP
jgi:hypothetical protein